MRLVEFLILILEAHAESLLRLAAFFGEDALFEILEDYGDRYTELTHGKPEARAQALIHGLIQEKKLTPPLARETSFAYQAIEGAVQNLQLPPPLEFHLWAYPFYRSFIESELDLDSKIAAATPFQAADTGSEMVEEAVSQAESWIQGLPLPPQVSKPAERAGFVPWLRFRTTALRRIGKRPIGPVY